MIFNETKETILKFGQHEIFIISKNVSVLGSFSERKAFAYYYYFFLKYNEFFIRQYEIYLKLACFYACKGNLSAKEYTILVYLVN